MKKVVWQEHHPDKQVYPEWTVRLRRNHHVFIRRLEQFKPTPDNLAEIKNVSTCIQYIIRKMADTLDTSTDNDYTNQVTLPQKNT